MDGDWERGAPLGASSGVRVTSIACGSSHSLALLGTGMAEISAVVCGAEFSVAMSHERQEVYSWGWGDFGRLGHGECNDVFIPRAIEALRGRAVVRVACGDTHTLAATEAGELYTFGRNSNGQLGHGTTDDSLAPRLVEALKGQPVGSIAAGGEHSIVALRSGGAVSWGWGRYGNLGDGTRVDRTLPTQGQPVASVSAGAEHSVAVTAAGAVFAWGWGRYGCLGDGAREDRWAPVQVNGLEGRVLRQVACGWRHTVVVDVDGGVYTFGWSKYGQLGHGDCQDQLAAKAVEALRGKRVMLVSGGWRHTVVADEAGHTFSWGWNKFGQLGTGDTADTNLPKRVEGLEGGEVVLLACGWRHTLLGTSNGDVYSWGRGVNGQLGHNEQRDLLSPRRLEALSAQTINLARLAATAGPTSSYVAPADRYAVVPGGPPSPGLHSGMAVPEMPEPKRQRAKS
ncbi:hypothetical protein WJX81_007348 [Elliptochloris bilobata]|uniref:RCC1-like domain-containing protein n=1 Tax=Elliptochloris bilobata TaxID=381761 RepID=A0AAW1QY88_9CHLO